MSSARPAPHPLTAWTTAALLGWGATAAYEANLHGDNIAGVLTIGLGVLALVGGWRGLVLYDERQVLRRAYRASKKRTTLHGAGRWATKKDVCRGGMRDPRGFFLGRFEGRDLFFNGEGSALFLAPPGAGKTTALVAQWLLRLNANSRSQIVCVLDPKLEAFALTSAALEAAGFEVKLICPWHETVSKEFGGRVALRDDGFDACQFLDPSLPSIIDDVTLLAALLVPESPRGSSESEKFWRQASMNVLIAFLLLELSRRGSVSLPRLRQMVMGPAEHVEADVAQMMDSEAFSGVLAECGNSIASLMEDEPRVWSSALAGAMQALRPYDAHSAISRSALKPGGVDFSALKDRPTAVFWGIPADKFVTHQAWVSTALTLSMEQLARDRRKVDCTLILEELQNCGRAVVEPVLKGIALYRGAGLRFLMLVQFLPALRRLAGDSFREFLSVELVAVFGAPSDTETLEMLSRLSGTTTRHEVSYSADAAALAAGGMSAGLSAREVSRPLLTPSEIRTLPRDEMVVWTSNLPPIRCTKQPYFDNRTLRRKAGRNPYNA